MPPRGKIELLIGPVGAGKTTYADTLVVRSKAVFFNLDSWMVQLYGADERPEEGIIAWYQERRERCRKLIWNTTLSVLNTGINVILEVGFIGAKERTLFYQQMTSSDIEFTVYLLDAPRDLRRQRVLQRNQSAKYDTQIVPMNFFEYASDAWEEPDSDERQHWSIIDV